MINREEHQQELPARELLFNLIKKSELNFGQGGNLRDVPRKVTIDGKEEELVGEFPSNHLLNVPSLFTVEGEQLEYALKTEAGDPDLKTLSAVFHALQQELTNIVAQISTNTFFVGRKVEVTEVQLAEAESLKEAVEKIESLNKNTETKTDLLSSVLQQIEHFKSFFDNLLPVLDKAGNLPGFSRESLNQLLSEVDAYLSTIDFRKEKVETRPDLFKRMGSELGEMASHYSEDRESWFYQFLVFASSVRAFDKTQEFVDVQIETVYPQLRGRWMETDPNQPPTEFRLPEDDANRDAH